jgi:DNA polymerase III alpha subunit
VVIMHTPPTKSGKRVMFLTLEDETGLFDVVVFSKAQSRFAKLILTSEHPCPVRAQPTMRIRSIIESWHTT